jgi:hypothetical protein
MSVFETVRREVEFGETSKSTLLWDEIIIRFTRPKSFKLFCNDTSLSLLIPWQRMVIS